MGAARGDYYWAGHPAGVMGRLLGCLRDGKVWSKPALIEALYGDDPDGGPLTADQIIDVSISRLRNQWRWPIRTEWGRGFYLEAASVDLLRIGTTARIIDRGDAMAGEIVYVTGGRRCGQPDASSLPILPVTVIGPGRSGLKPRRVPADILMPLRLHRLDAVAA